MKRFVRYLLVVGGLVLVSGCQSLSGGFPYRLPNEKPNRVLSAAVERVYDTWRTPLAEDNELYSQFKYTELKGFDYNGCDGTISRRDPSKVIQYKGKYYVWYTHRDVGVAPQRSEQTVPNVPSRDWDLSEIWYATSEDGFTWHEQGVAVPIPSGVRSVATADVLKWEGMFYLYYQAFPDTGDGAINDCYVTASFAETPFGPWTPANQVVVANGPKGDWDSRTLHDPNPMVYNGKIYLYYKSDFDDTVAHYVKMTGVAIAEHPLGPFRKHVLNPVLNSGHETCLFLFESGIAALVIRDGNEHFTIQYAPDGINFEIMAITELMPISAGPYVPEAFSDSGDAPGITWGLCHVNHAQTVKGTQNSILVRFDCDLSRDLDDPEMKKSRYLYKPDFYYGHGLTPTQRKRLLGNKAVRLVESEK